MHALDVLGDLRIDLRVGALEVARRDQRRTTVAGAGQVDDLLTGVLDQPGGMRVEEGQTRTGAPMPEQSGLDVFRRQRLTQQRVRQQVDLADGQVVVGPPPGVQHGYLIGARSRERLDQVGGRCDGLVIDGHGSCSFAPRLVTPEPVRSLTPSHPCQERWASPEPGGFGCSDPSC